MDRMGFCINSWHNYRLGDNGKDWRDQGKEDCGKYEQLMFDLQESTGDKYPGPRSGTRAQWALGPWPGEIYCGSTMLRLLCLSFSL